VVKLLYFAWVRERIGFAHERVETTAETIQELVEELRAKEDRYAQAFTDLSALKVAVDAELTDFDAPLKDAKEIAFFPPMTGG